MNFREVRGPYGGANAFQRTIRRALERRGHRVTTREDDRYDVALVNALTDDIDLAFVQRIAERAPVVHRKVGYRVSGSADLRARVDGVVVGDRIQVEFTPHLAHTVFQSAYSRDVFLGSGFAGPFTVVHNGVDEEIFTPWVRAGLPWRGRRRRELRPFWDGRSPLRVVISAWSTDPNKGFEDYAAIDRALDGRDDVELSLVGRVPNGLELRNIRLHAARPARPLADVLRANHALLQLARWETCSNALIEGLNCGLPAIYLDSGANGEVAGEYGVEYRGDFFAALDEVRERYDELVARVLENPYRSAVMVEQYEAVLRAAAEGRA